MADAHTDYHGLLQANLERVFSERDAGKRLEVIQRLYAPEAVLYEPQAAIAGHAAICATVTALLASLPADCVFRALGPATGHHGIGRLLWSAGPPHGPAAVTGMDIAHIENGRIRALFVFLDGDAK